MKIMRAGERPCKMANPDWFTGRVWQEPVVEAEAPARVRALKVTFEPEARTAWHTHPLGQTLHVLSGVGLVGLRGEASKVIRPGDTVWIPPGVEHWHGAAPESQMCHLAMQEADDAGRVADWLDQVSEAEYRRTTR
jgi:quercetin dioxygenase-like cupin family protein